MLSNGALLLAASNLRPTSNYRPEIPALRCAGPSNSPICLALPRNESRQYDSNVKMDCLPSDQPFDANECIVHRAMWGWSLFIMVCMPYAFVFLRNLKRVVSCKYRRPVNWKTLGIVLIPETLYAIGMSMLVFIVLPSVDNIIEVRENLFTELCSLLLCSNYCEHFLL